MSGGDCAGNCAGCACGNPRVDPFDGVISELEEVAQQLASLTPEDIEEIKRGQMHQFINMMISGYEHDLGEDKNKAYREKQRLFKGRSYITSFIQNLEKVGEDDGLTYKVTEGQLYRLLEMVPEEYRLEFLRDFQNRSMLGRINTDYLRVLLLFRSGHERRSARKALNLPGWDA